MKLLPQFTQTTLDAVHAAHTLPMLERLRLKLSSEAFGYAVRTSWLCDVERVKLEAK